MDFSKFFIDFKQARMVNGIVSASMLFFRQNIQLYTNYLLRYFSIPVLVASYFFAKLTIDHPNMMMNMQEGKIKPQDLLSILPSFLVPFLMLFVIQIFFYSFVYGHVEQYIEKQSPALDLGSIFKSGLKRVLWQFIGFTLLLVLLIGLLTLITLLSGATKGISFFAFAGVVYLLVPMGLVSPILFFEGEGFNSAFARAMYLIRGSWFHLLIAFFMSVSIVFSVSFVASIPVQLLATAINQFIPSAASSVVVQTIIQTISSFLSLFASGFIIVASSMIYFSQVQKLDGKGKGV